MVMDWNEYDRQPKQHPTRGAKQMTLEQILREVQSGESINWAIAEIHALIEKGEL